MSWETRRNGRTYYYTAERDGGQVVKRYLGSGELAASLAALAADDRDEQRAAREREHLEQAGWELLADAMERTVQAAEQELRAVLTQAGYRQHHRGQWRRARAKEATRQDR